MNTCEVVMIRSAFFFFDERNETYSCINNSVGLVIEYCFIPYGIELYQWEYIIK